MSSSRFGRAKHRCVAVVAALAGLLALGAPVASARYAYVTNSGGGTVSVLNTATSSTVATIAVGGEPVALAITPDGRRAYVVNAAAGTVAVIDTGSNAMVGAPIPVGLKPRGIAITPDGSRAYVANSGDGTVTVIDTATNATLGLPITVGKEPSGIAISPDGRSAFVAQLGGDVSVIDTSNDTVAGSVPDALAPSRIAITPDGSRAFATNSGSNSITAFNPANGSVVSAPIAVGKEPDGIAIAPSGQLAYVASAADGTLTPIDTSLNSPPGAPIAFSGATGVAIEPGGLRGYVTDASGNTISVLDTTSSAAAGTIPVGAAPTDVAVVPDQGPHASFWVSPTKRRAKKKLTFHASGSSDPDGEIATYAWDFGDGVHVKSSSATSVHRYRKPGTYRVTLVTTDNEGCSTELVYTGQTASCNGTAAAMATATLTVLDAAGPTLRLTGARSQRLRGLVDVFARCPREPCSLQGRGVVVTTVEAGAVSHRSTHRLGGATVSLPSRRRRRLALRIPGSTRRAVLRALRRGGEAKAMVTVLATDTTGDQTQSGRTVKLISPGR